MVDGRAELVAEELCDGIGLCASVCPNRAIRMENRQAVPFDPEGSASRRLAPGIGPEAEFRRRLQICCRASNCGRLCPRLVKQPGKAGVWCVDIQTGGKTELYRVLADPAFKCPEERF
jgi:ferredoxin